MRRELKAIAERLSRVVAGGAVAAYSALVWPPSMSITEPLMKVALIEHR